MLRVCLSLHRRLSVRLPALYVWQPSSLAGLHRLWTRRKPWLSSCCLPACLLAALMTDSLLLVCPLLFLVQRDMFESTMMIGQMQADAAMGLYNQATTPVHGAVDWRHQFVNMQNVTVWPHFTSTGWTALHWLFFLCHRPGCVPLVQARPRSRAPPHSATVLPVSLGRVLLGLPWLMTGAVFACSRHHGRTWRFRLRAGCVFVAASASGRSFSSDTPGLAGSNSSNPFWNFISSFLAKPTPAQILCQV